MKQKILNELNECLRMMDKRVTEGSVNTQIELFGNMINKNYSVDNEFEDKIEKIKKISDYNVRKKLLKDLFREYVR